MKISIQMLSVDHENLYFFFDYSQQPAIEWNKVQYSSLGRLLKALPDLQKTQHVEKLAQVANFLTKGLEFTFIDNIELFKSQYCQQIEAEQMSMENAKPMLKGYGTYDLSVMQPPRIINHRLVFFVKHDYLSIPYQASIIFSNDLENVTVHYELLPLLETTNERISVS